MSTKIYTGHRLQMTDLAEIHAEAQAFRREIKAVVKERQLREWASAMTGIVDRRALGLDVGHKPPHVAGWGIAFGDDDQERCDIVLCPHAGCVYGMVFAHPDDLSELWLSKPFVERWGYWDNTDRPDDVTDAEWEERKRTWDAILGETWIPAMEGFKVQCLEQRRPTLSLNDAMPFIPSLDVRAKTEAIDILYGRYCEKATGFGHYLEFRAWLKESDGQAALAAEQEAVRRRLVPTITIGMLRGDAV